MWWKYLLVFGLGGTLGYLLCCLMVLASTDPHGPEE